MTDKQERKLKQVWNTLTDKEKAEYILWQNDCYTHEGNFIRADKVLDLVSQGLAEGRKEKWHDLREDPTDLPPKEYADSSHSINVFTDTEDNAFYSYLYNVWVRESDCLKIPKVIAWTELPKFKE